MDRPVAGDRSRFAHEQWAILDQAKTIVDDVDHFLEHLQVRALSSLREDLLGTSAHLRRQGAQHRGFFDPRVPHRKRAHLGVAPYLRAVYRHRGTRGGFGAALTCAEMTCADDRARGEPLQVPFPGCRIGLVEIVDPEDEIPFGRGEYAEVRHVRVAARLDAKAGRRRCGEVGRHHRGRSAQERERRREHTLVAYRHQVRQSGFRLRLQYRHRIGAGSRRLVFGVTRARHAQAQFLACCQA